VFDGERGPGQEERGGRGGVRGGEVEGCSSVEGRGGGKTRDGRWEGGWVGGGGVDRRGGEGVVRPIRRWRGGES